MKKVQSIEEVINSSIIKPKSKIYISGNAATPQIMLNQLANDTDIKDIELLHVLLLGNIDRLFEEDTCQRITHRVVFNGPNSRKAVNQGWAKYQLMHLSDIPRQLKEYIQPNIAMISVSGPDNGGNYSLGTTVEGVMAAIESAKKQGGIVIAERNAQMPFVLGTTIPADTIDYLFDCDYPLPVSPVHPPDESSKKIGEIIAKLYINDGATLQYGIGQVPEAVTDAIIEKGVKDLGIHTELFADAMRRLVEEGAVSNRYTYKRNNFSLSSIFLAGSEKGYQWLNYNSSIQSRPSDYTNSILNIAREPNMVSINSAIGTDLHGNIWADSLEARQIYSGVGGQSDFLRGGYQSPNGVPIIAMKSMTMKNKSKVVDKCPPGITTTAIAADPVIIVTENGSFDPRGLSISERATGIAFLAAPEERESLLKHIYDSPEFHNPSKSMQKGYPKGFTAYEKIK